MSHYFLWDGEESLLKNDSNRFPSPKTGDPSPYFYAPSPLFGRLTLFLQTIFRDFSRSILGVLDLCLFDFCFALRFEGTIFRMVWVGGHERWSKMF